MRSQSIIFLFTFCFSVLCWAKPPTKLATYVESTQLLTTVLQHPEVIERFKHFGPIDQVIITVQLVTVFNKNCSASVVFHIEENETGLEVVIDSFSEPACSVSGVSVGSH